MWNLTDLLLPFLIVSLLCKSMGSIVKGLLPGIPAKSREQIIRFLQLSLVAACLSFCHLQLLNLTKNSNFGLIYAVLSIIILPFAVLVFLNYWDEGRISVKTPNFNKNLSD